MPTARSWQPLAILLLVAIPALACNLTTNTSAPPTPVPPVDTPPPGSAPTVNVLWPPGGSEFVVGQEITIQVSASDVAGVTRIELRSANSVLSSRPSPDQEGQETFDAILPWTPSRDGPHDLQVIAYRRRTPSPPFLLTLLIRSHASEVIATPIPFVAGGAPMPTSLPGSGVACQVRVDISDLRFRTGPGTNYAILGLLDLGETLRVTGQNAAGTWWQINRDSETAWVASDRNYSTPLTDCAAAPIVNPPR